MMTAGWMPIQSCYQPTDSVSSVGTAPLLASTDLQAAVNVAETGSPTGATCNHPTWFYSLVAFAAIAAISARRRK